MKILLISLPLLFVGCSDKQLYQSFEKTRIDQCNKQADVSYDECVEQNRVSYEEYEANRESSQ